jgi:hypothetical protein
MPVESLDRAAWKTFTRGVGRPNLVHAANRAHAPTKSGAKLASRECTPNERNRQHKMSVELHQIREALDVREQIRV